MSLSWITDRINATLDKFSISVENFKARSEKVAQEQQRRIISLEQRISILEKHLAENHVVDRRKDSAEPQISTQTNSSPGTSPFFTQQSDESTNQDSLILLSFDERLRGVDPMDMSFQPLSPDEGPSEAWRRDWTRLSCQDGYSNPDPGEDSDQEDEMDAASMQPRVNGQAHPVEDHNPTTWS